MAFNIVFDIPSLPLLIFEFSFNIIMVISSSVTGVILNEVSHGDVR